MSLPCYVTRMYDRSDGVIVFHGQSFSMMIDSLYRGCKGDAGGDVCFHDVLI